MRLLKPTVSMLLMVALLVVATGPTAGAQTDGDARLGGASDVATNTVVRIPQGGEIGPLHYIFVDNPEDEPIGVEFVVDAPAGIVIEPEWEEAVVPARGRMENTFGIAVSRTVGPGDYEVVVQLLRSDIEARPGQVTNIPAVQTSFTVEVTGEAGTLRVEAVSAVSGQPVAGTLSVAARTGDDAYFEVARTDGFDLEVEVAPGDYRVSFLLGDRILSTSEAAVEADAHTEVELEVETVSFVLAAVRPTFESDRPVLVDLVAAVNNEAEPVTTGAELRVVVLHDGVEVDTVTLDQLPELPIGLTEATSSYRPTDGWRQGTYRFRFELATPDFVLTAPEMPSLDVPPLPAWDLRLLLLLAAGALLALLVLERIGRIIVGKMRRRRGAENGRHLVDATSSPDSGPASNNAAVLSSQPTVKWAPVASTSEPSAPSSGADQGSGAVSPDTGDTSEGGEPAGLIPPPSPARSTRRPPPPSGGAARVAHAIRLAQRLADDGALASDWSIADAALVYWAMTSQEVHEALTSLGMDEDEYTRAITKLLHLGLLDPSSR